MVLVLVLVLACWVLDTRLRRSHSRRLAYPNDVRRHNIRRNTDCRPGTSTWRRTAALFPVTCYTEARVRSLQWRMTTGEVTALTTIGHTTSLPVRLLRKAYYFGGKREDAQQAPPLHDELFRQHERLFISSTIQHNVLTTQRLATVFWQRYTTFWFLNCYNQLTPITWKPRDSKNPNTEFHVRQSINIIDI